MYYISTCKAKTKRHCSKGRTFITMFVNMNAPIKKQDNLLNHVEVNNKLKAQ